MAAPTAMANIFKVGINGTGFTNLVSFSGTSGSFLGDGPYGDLTLSGTTLYGMTSSGGTAGYGNVFSVGINGTGFQNIVSFTGADGRLSHGAV